MLLWVAAGLFVASFASFAFDKSVALYYGARKKKRWRKRVWATTDFAKAGHWLIVVVLAYAGTQAAIALGYKTPAIRTVSDYALALLLSMLAASAILHTIKLFIGRRRPRDLFDHNFYGWEFFKFDTTHDSFPSGHAQTIFCVATAATAAWPEPWPLWFAIAAYLALTRALLTSHFLSDVLFGAALGLAVSREIFVNVFPALAPAWF